MERESGNGPAFNRPQLLLLSLLAAAVILAGVYLVYRLIASPAEDPLAEVTEGTVEAWPDAPPTFTATPPASPSATLPPLETPTPTPRPTPPPLPVWGELGHLTSIRFTASTVVEWQREREGFIDDILGPERVLLMAIGDVQAGVDLDQIESEDVDRDGTSVRVAVPHARVTSVELLPGRTTIYESNRRIILSEYEGLETEALEQARLQLRAEAEGNQGMMALADRVARLQLSELLYRLGFTEVEIVFRD